MKRLILLFDGTWNTLTNPDEATNVVRVGQAVMPIAADNVPQIVYYNSGVGSGGKVDQFLGGVFGAGVRSNVQRGLTFLSFNYDNGEPEVEGGPRRDAGRDLHLRLLARRLHCPRACWRDRRDTWNSQGLALWRSGGHVEPLQEEQRRSREEPGRHQENALRSAPERKAHQVRCGLGHGRLVRHSRGAWARRIGTLDHVVDSQLPRQ